MSKFEKNARVFLPEGGSFDGVMLRLSCTQAVVIDITETVPGFPVYTLRWLDEAGETHTGTCGEGDLSAANEPLCGYEAPSPLLPTIDVSGEARSRKRKPATKRKR